MRLVAILAVLGVGIAGAAWLLNGPTPEQVETSSTQSPEVSGTSPTLLGAPAHTTTVEKTTDTRAARGLVVDSKGEPLAGIAVVARRDARGAEPDAAWEVRAFLEATQRVRHPAPVVGQATTDAKGAFRLTGLPATGDLTVYADVATPQTTTSRPVDASTKHGILLIVGQGTPLRGRVLTRDDRPVHAWVSAHGVATNTVRSMYVAPVETDERGQFTLGATEAGTLYLTVHVPGHGVDVAPSVKTPRTDELIVRFDTQGGVTFRGTARNSTGQPIGGAHVAARVRTADNGDVTRVTTTEADGTYVLAGLPSGVMAGVDAAAAGYVPLRAIAQGLEVQAPTTQTLDIALLKSATVKGRVLSNTNEPITGAFVSLTADTRGSIFSGSGDEVVRTNDAGQYAFVDVAPISAGRLKVEAPGFHEPHIPVSINRFESRRSQGWQVAVAEGQTLERDLVLRQPSIPVTGFVRTRKGEGIADATVRLTFKRAGDGGWNPWQDIVRHEVRTDHEGAFRHPGLTPNTTWTIEADHPIWVGPSVSLRIPRTAAVVETSLTLGPGATVRGTTLGPGGKLAAGETVSSGSHVAISDAKGAFELSGLAPGKRRVVLASQMHDYSSGASVSLDWSEVVEGIVLRGSIPCVVSGVVVDPAGNAMPRFMISVQIQLPDGRSTVYGFSTDTEGRFSTPHLNGGVVTISMQGMSEPLVVDPPQTDLRIVTTATTPKTIQVSGQVFAPDGSPAFGGQVSVRTENSAHYVPVFLGRFRADVVTDTEASFAVIALTDASGKRVPYVRQTLRTTPTAEEMIEIRLKAGRTVRGHVVDAAGQPVTHVAVAAELANGESQFMDRFDGRAPPTSTSHKDGRFMLRGLDPTQMYTISVKPSAGWATPELIALSADEDELRIELQRALALEGTVQTPGGGPAAGAVVTATAGVDTKSGYTNALGAFRLEGVHPARKYLVQATPHDASEHMNSTPQQDVRAAGGALRLRLQQGARIEGKVSAEDGSALPPHSAVVTVTSADGDRELSSTLCEHDGTFRSDLMAPGRYQVSTTSRNELWGASKPLEASAPAKNVQLVLPRGHPIRGKVEGLREHGFHVSVIHKGKRLSAPRVRDDGTFLIGQDADRTVSLFVHKDDDPRFAAATSVEGGSEVTLTMRQGKSIEGRITFSDQPDTPPRTRRIQATQDGLVVSAKINRDGTYRIQGLPNGRWTIYVHETPGLAPRHGVAAGATGIDFTVSTSAAPAVGGAPTAAPGAPIPATLPPPAPPPVAPGGGSCGGCGGGSCGGSGGSCG